MPPPQPLALTPKIISEAEKGLAQASGAAAPKTRAATANRKMGNIRMYLIIPITPLGLSVLGYSGETPPITGHPEDRSVALRGPKAKPPMDCCDKCVTCILYLL